MVDADGEVAQASHDAREMAGMDFGVVLAVPAVADVLQCLHFPVAADGGGEFGRGGLAGVGAGDGVERLAGLAPGVCRRRRWTRA